jgi:hypothetical protein
MPAGGARSSWRTLGADKGEWTFTDERFTFTNRNPGRYAGNSGWAEYDKEMAAQRTTEHLAEITAGGHRADAAQATADLLRPSPAPLEPVAAAPTPVPDAAQAAPHTVATPPAAASPVPTGHPPAPIPTWLPMPTPTGQVLPPGAVGSHGPAFTDPIVYPRQYKLP